MAQRVYWGGEAKGAFLEMEENELDRHPITNYDTELQIQDLLKKAEEVLRGGGQLATTLSDLILGFHRGFRRRGSHRE